MTQAKPLNVRGFLIYKSFISARDQIDILNAIRAGLPQAPMFSPVTVSGKLMSIQMSSVGRYGWFSDRRGYRYESKHPNGNNWPSIPQSILNIWDKILGSQRQPDCCLINYYSETARMGLHQDNDEQDFTVPVLSISLGDDALFRIGGLTRKDRTQSVWLSSGDVVVMGGESRLAFHGVDRIRFGTSNLLKNAGRINLTLRVVD